MRASVQWVAMGLAALLVAAADAEKKDAAKSVEGTWKVTSLEVNGETQGADEAAQYTLVFAADKFTVDRGGQRIMKGTLTVDAAASPARMDLKLEENADHPEDVGKTLAGIYEVTGEEMRWCFGLPAGAERPADFKTSQDSGRVLAVMKREKK
jgi:uncharacterized protein (TIGR03067 family)